LAGEVVRVVYIAHPLNDPSAIQRAENLTRATRWVVWASQQGVAPVADWILIAGTEETPESRERGLRIDFALIERCEELWMVGGRISPGMMAEREHAFRSGLTIRDLTGLGPEPPLEKFDETKWPVR
jgi:hypothetical protein